MSHKARWCRVCGQPFHGHGLWDVCPGCRAESRTRRGRMAMDGYEPASGFNLPPGCFERDVDASFAAPPTCGDCREAMEMVCDFCVCRRELGEWWRGHPRATAYEAAEWVADHMRDMQEDSCPSFTE